MWSCILCQSQAHSRIVMDKQIWFLLFFHVFYKVRFWNHLVGSFGYKYLQCTVNQVTVIYIHVAIHVHVYVLHKVAESLGKWMIWCTTIAESLGKWMIWVLIRRCTDSQILAVWTLYCKVYPCTCMIASSFTLCSFYRNKFMQIQGSTRK